MLTLSKLFASNFSFNKQKLDIIAVVGATLIRTRRNSRVFFGWCSERKSTLSESASLIFMVEINKKRGVFLHLSIISRPRVTYV